jgi:hypothetical protein
MSTQVDNKMVETFSAKCEIQWLARDCSLLLGTPKCSKFAGDTT